MRSLDLSNQGLSSLSDCQTAQSLRKVLQDCHVTKKHLRTCKLEETTHLYLEGNGIWSLLIWNLLEVFPKLVWLDLRNNQLISLGGVAEDKQEELENKSSEIQGRKLDKHVRIKMRVPTVAVEDSSGTSGQVQDQQATSDYDESSSDYLSPSTSPTPIKKNSLSSTLLKENKGYSAGSSTALSEPCVSDLPVARHLRSVLLQNNRLIRTPWMLSRPEYFPALKNIATGGNPLISEEESPPRKQKQHDRNNPTSKSNKTTANNFESDSGVASSHEEEWASNNSGKNSRTESDGNQKTEITLQEEKWKHPDIQRHLPRSDDDDVESPAINEDRTRWKSKGGQKRRKASNHVKKNARDPLFHYHRRNSLALLEDDVVPTCQCSGGEKGVVIRRLLKQKTWLRLVGCNRKGGSGVWRSEILDWECQGPDQEEVNFNTQQRRALRAVKRKREEVEAKLQRVKDAEVLKCWRRRMRGLQQDSIWKSVPEHLRPGTAHYTMTNEPHGTDRDRRLPQRKNVMFDSVPESDHDRAVDQLMAEMDRVLARRPPPSSSYLDDHAISRQELEPIPPRELLRSSHEMRRVEGQIKKAAVAHSAAAQEPNGERNEDRPAKTPIGYTYNMNGYSSS